MADSKASFLWAIKQQESGGNYNSVNSGSGALGAYQVMPENVASWTQQALGHSLSASQFLNNPSAQDAVANAILGGYYDRYGADGAAAMWYSGQPDPTKTFGSPTVAEYVSQVKSKMTSGSPVGDTTPATGAFDPFNPLGIPTPEDLSKGLQQGMTSAIKATVGPMLMWGTWMASAGIGIVLMIFGAFLMVRGSSPYKTVQSTIKNMAEDAVPEAKAVKAVKPKSPAKSEYQLRAERQARARERAHDPQRVFEKRRMGDIDRRMKEGRKGSKSE